MGSWAGVLQISETARISLGVTDDPYFRNILGHGITKSWRWVGRLNVEQWGLHSHQQQKHLPETMDSLSPRPLPNHHRLDRLPELTANRRSFRWAVRLTITSRSHCQIFTDGFESQERAWVYIYIYMGIGMRTRNMHKPPSSSAGASFSSLPHSSVSTRNGNKN